MIRFLIILTLYFCEVELKLIGTSFNETHAPINRMPDELFHNFADRLFKDYDGLHRPGSLIKPTQTSVVEVDIFVNSFSHISIIQMDYGVDMHIRQRWNDYRLKFNSADEKIIPLTTLKIKDIWTPDLYFVNGKGGFFHKVTQPNEMLNIEESGNVLFKQKISTTLSCPMDLVNFPMDTQFCEMTIGSFGYRSKDMVIKWRFDDPENAHKNIVIHKHINLNEYHLPKVTTSNCTQRYDRWLGDFACIKARFKFVRKFDFYMIYTFFPSILTVMTSWLSFLIDFKVVPARISLALLTMLALMTQCTSTVKMLPPVSYIKAIDVWIFTCLSFVIVAMVEFSFISAMCRVVNTDPKTASKSTRKRRGSLIPLELIARVWNAKFFVETGYTVDRIMFYAFPGAFLLFNAFYWGLYRNYINEFIN